MRLRTLLIAGTVVWAATGAGVGGGLYMTFQDLDEALRKDRVARDIGRGVFELTVLTGDYLLHHEIRAQTQWQHKHEALGRLLEEPAFEPAGGEPAVAALRADHLAITDAFAKLIAAFAARRTQGADAGQSSALEQRLVTVILIKSQTMVSEAFRLASRSELDMADATRRAQGFVILLIVIIVIMVTGTWIVFARRVVGPIRELHRGIGIVGGGNLDYRIGAFGRDELGEVARSFDDMAKHLRDERERVAEEIAERKQSEEALQEKTRLIQLLQTIAVAANEAATVDEAMQVCLDAVCAHTGWPVGHVYMLDESDTGELVPTNVWHLDHPEEFKTFQEVTRKTRFMPGIGLPGRVLASGEPAWITDVTEDPNFPRAKIAQDIGVKAGFGFPVIVGKSVVGVLEFFSTDAVEPDEEMLEAMGHVGTQLGRVVERERAEKAEAQLRQAQKMEAVGNLTGGVAHDFNNLLTIILGNLQLLERRLESDARLSKWVRAASEAAMRGANLTKRLLAFSRRQVLEPKVVDLNKLVAGMDDPLRRTLGEAIEIKTTLSADLLPTRIDLNQLESALLNLAINARDAMPAGGKLTIETTNAFLDEDYAARHAEVTAGDYVMLAVSDSGAGMSAEVIEHAFEPFYTTKEVGKGSGLGLSMVYGFVKQSAGHVKIYSEEGHGTTVKLYLPRAKAGDGAAAEEAARAAAVRTGGETILVVEDDAAVREIAIALLEDRGYRVLEAEDGAGALKLLDEHPEIDLLLTDVVMPGGINGPDLARKAQARKPSLKVLYTSGYTENAIVHRGALDEGVEMIGKPYQKDELAHKVRRVLDR